MVDNNSKVTDSARRRLDAGVRQLEQVDSTLRYTTSRPKPDDFRLGRIKTQAVTRHTRSNTGDALQSAMRAINVADWAGLT